MRRLFTRPADGRGAGPLNKSSMEQPGHGPRWHVKRCKECGHCVRVVSRERAIKGCHDTKSTRDMLLYPHRPSNDTSRTGPHRGRQGMGIRTNLQGKQVWSRGFISSFRLNRVRPSGENSRRLSFPAPRFHVFASSAGTGQVDGRTRDEF